MIFKLLSFILICGTLVSCKQSCDEEARKIMGDLYRKKIQLPKDMNLVNAKYVTDVNSFNLNNPDFDFYILRMFSMDCDKCIASLQTARDYIAASGFVNRMKFVFVASGYTEIYIREAIERLKFQYPVYIVKDINSFYEQNDLPQGMEGTYGTMLINKLGEVLLFGSVYDNATAKKVYSDIINCRR